MWPPRHRIYYARTVRNVLVLGAVALLACKQAAPPPPPPPPAHSDLVVVTPGAPPQQLLRYHLVKGTKATVELELEAKLQAGELKSASPSLAFTLELAVDEVLEDGRMKLASTITELTVRGAPDQPGVPHVASEATAIKGLAVTALLLPDGSITDVHANIGDKQLSDQAQAEVAQIVQAMPKLVMPLPSVPVGVGAKWRTSRGLGPASPLTLTSVTTIDLTGASHDVISYAVSSTVHGDDQVVKQDGVEVACKAISGTATGNGSFDLSKLAVNGALTAELHMDMTTGSDQTSMTMALELHTTSH